MIEKRLINYARTYRHLQTDWRVAVLYLLLLTLPLALLLLIFMGNITDFVSDVAEHLLTRAMPNLKVGRDAIMFTPISRINYLTLPTKLPAPQLVVFNLLISVGISFLVSMFDWKGEPLPIFVVLNALYHTINCIFFLFAPTEFKLSTTDYSALCMSEEVGIWFTFIVLSGLTTAFIGSRGLLYKVLTCAAILIYSLALGLVRYALFLYLLTRFSILYMCLMFFTVGPLFDYLYFVMFYALFIDRMIKLYDSKEERSSWKWS